MPRFSNDAIAAIPAISAIAATCAAAGVHASRTGLRFFELTVLLGALGVHAGAHAATVLDLPSRPGITQQVSLEAVDAPRAVALLFAGGEGAVRFDAEGVPTTLRGNFLLRARALFHPFQIATVVMGLPTDQASALTDAFRASPEHARDVAAVIAEMRQRWHVPVWLVATSRGTLSGAAVALNLGAPEAGPDGIVLTSTMTSITDFAIDHFAQPVLVVQHRNDQCRATNVHDLPRIKDKLKAPRSEVLMVSGGVSRGQWCEAFAYHGFNGIEDEVVADIANWILGK